ncbi:uncharacterized protein [Cherax quadricarinatus]|uniref:uncharacterized protein n=1 Tax=Cherax quadricarinatus TaxID=27406 RepID=UPI00387E3DA0
MLTQCTACMILASLAAAAPENFPHFQTYRATGVLKPESKELGSSERLVAATIDLLPEIADVFERVGGVSSNDPEAVQQAIVEFLPLTRTSIKAAAEAEGREVNEDHLRRLSAAEAVMPAVNDFMNRLRRINFFRITDNQQQQYQ